MCVCLKLSTLRGTSDDDDYLDLLINTKPPSDLNSDAFSLSVLKSFFLVALSA